MFDTLQDRLAATFKSLRGKGRITEADIDETAREIRRALLEADVNLAVVKDFVTAVKERSRDTELHAALKRQGMNAAIIPIMVGTVGIAIGYRPGGGFVGVAGAVLLAMLAAKGTSSVRGISLIDRGYEHFMDKLGALGADFSRD